MYGDPFIMDSIKANNKVSSNICDIKYIWKPIDTSIWETVTGEDNRRIIFSYNTTCPITWEVISM